MSVTQCGSGSGDGDRERDKHTDELVATGTSTNIVYSLCRILYSEIMKAKCFFFPHIYWHDRSGQSVRHM